MSKKLTIVVVAGGICALIAASAGFFAMWSKVSAMEHMIAALQQENQDESAGGAGAIGPLYSLETMIVNLGDEGGKRYLRVTMDLELQDPKLVEPIKARLPQIKDGILRILPTKSVDEINSAQGKLALRDELIASLNGFLGKDAITNIYFTEFVIQ